MEKECNAHSCCRVYQKLSGPIELLLLKEKNPANIQNMQYLSFNACDLFLVLLTEPDLCCLAFASKLYLNQSWDSKGQSCVFLGYPIAVVKCSNCQKEIVLYIISIFAVLCPHGPLWFDLFLLFVQNWWSKAVLYLSRRRRACFGSWANLCYLSLPFETELGSVDLENLQEFARRMNEQAIGF